MPKITFSKRQITLDVAAGVDLIKACKNHLPFGCTRGECGTCVIKVLEGGEHLTQCSPEEKCTLRRLNLDETHRLACQCALNGDITIEG